MKAMYLQRLRYFVTVAEELHFGRAAQRLGIAQPPLSRQIRRLEEEVGVSLFDRVKRRIYLNDAGQVFLEEARAVVSQIERAIRATQAASRGESGRLAIGFINSATCDVLPAILPEFRERFPNVELALRELPTARQVQGLRHGRLDIGFLRGPVQDQTLILEPVFRGPLLVALPATHPLASKLKVPLKALADEPFVLFPRHFTPGHYDQILLLCHQAGFTPRIVQEALQLQTAIGLVAVGVGVSFVAPSLRRLQREGVVYREIDAQPPPEVETLLAWRRDQTSAVTRAFLNVAREVFPQPAAGAYAARAHAVPAGGVRAPAPFGVEAPCR